MRPAVARRRSARSRPAKRDDGLDAGRVAELPRLARAGVLGQPEGGRDLVVGHARLLVVHLGGGDAAHAEVLHRAVGALPRGEVPVVAEEEETVGHDVALADVAGAHAAYRMVTRLRRCQGLVQDLEDVRDATPRRHGARVRRWRRSGHSSGSPRGHSTSVGRSNASFRRADAASSVSAATFRRRTRTPASRMACSSSGSNESVLSAW